MKLVNYIKRIIWRILRRPVAPQPPVSFGTLCPYDVKKDYESLWSQMRIKNTAGTNLVMIKMWEHHGRYITVSKATGVPWEVVAIIHGLEAALSFYGCLHNGDSWKRVTKNVPKGLGPWATWEDSAIDALNRKRKPVTWSLTNTLWFLENYNGLGYRKYHPHVKSPYLWAATTCYGKGKYASDGKWDENLVSKQIGACALLWEFEYDVKVEGAVRHG